MKKYNISMKFLGVLLFVATVVLTSFSCSESPLTEDPDGANKKSIRLNVATINVLSSTMDNYIIETYGDDRQIWKNRKGVIANIINTRRFDVFGAQELTSEAMKNDLKELLPDYASTTNPDREDVIYWHKERYTLVEEGDFLVNNGDAGLDEALTYAARFIVWVKLKEKETGEEFFVFNGHAIVTKEKVSFRTGFANELVRQEKELNGERLPAFFVGDFNAYDERGSDEFSAGYNNIFGAAGFANVMNVARQKINEQYGTAATLGSKPSTSWAWLDRIYVSEGSKADVIVYRYEAIIDFDPDRPGWRKIPAPADHFPITANVELVF